MFLGGSPTWEAQKWLKTLVLGQIPCRTKNVAWNPSFQTAPVLGPGIEFTSRSGPFFGLGLFPENAGFWPKKGVFLGGHQTVEVAFVHFPHVEARFAGLPPHVVPIFPTSRSLKIHPSHFGSRLSLVRIQLPLIVARAITGHAAQGKTMEAAPSLRSDPGASAPLLICNISNTNLNYEILKSHSNIQENNKIINQYLKQQNIETTYIVEDNYVGIKQSNTPTNTPMITV